MMYRENSGRKLREIVVNLKNNKVGFYPGKVPDIVYGDVIYNVKIRKFWRIIKKFGIVKLIIKRNDRVDPYCNTSDWALIGEGFGIYFMIECFPEYPTGKSLYEVTLSVLPFWKYKEIWKCMKLSENEKRRKTERELVQSKD